MAIKNFIPQLPSVEDCWRGVILYGRNSATYKFALASSLLELKPKAGQLVKMEEIALPFGKSISQHMKESPKQGISSNSKFLKACNEFQTTNDGKKLVDACLSYGFQNVIDAFHIVGSTPVAKKFFIDDRKSKKGLIITDEFEKMLEGYQSQNITQEVDSRWRLVESAWSLEIAVNHLIVKHDNELGEIFTFDSGKRRKSLTSTRGALNGYQKGRCFYCFSEIQISGKNNDSDVDHFFPHRLKTSELHFNLDGVWNLVLSCRNCNRGHDGKFDKIPSQNLLERLHTRNEYLINSHHPLRETLISQTGYSEENRAKFLSDAYNKVQIHRDGWNPKETFWENQL